jgi:hypothetical protein
MVNFHPRELVLELAYFCNVGIHGVFVDVLLIVDFLNHQ